MPRKYPKHATIFSIASEQCRRMGIESIANLLCDVLPTSMVHSYVGEYAPELAVRLFGDAAHAKRLLIEHSHFRLVGGLLGKETESAVFDSALCGGAWHRKLFDNLRSKRGIESRVLRSCEHCVASDLKKYGVAHWRVFHQWPGVQTCEMHDGLLREDCAECGEPRYQCDNPRMAHDPCTHCGSLEFAPRELGEELIEQKMVKVFYDLYFRTSEDPECHRPMRRDAAITAARVAWYDANEDAQPLLRVSYEFECHSVEELAERLDCTYLPNHVGDDLMEDQSVAPILIIACIAAAEMEPRTQNRTNFNRPKLRELPPDIHPACVPRLPRIPAWRSESLEPLRIFVEQPRAR